MPTLALAPNQAGYSVDVPSDDLLSVKLDGGLSRYRLDVLNAAFTVNVQWSVGPTEYAYLRAFYRNSIRSGTNSFTINLPIDGPELEEYEAHFVPGTFALDSISGLQYNVKASMEVKPNVANDDYDAALVIMYENYNGQLAQFLNGLERFTNSSMPARI